MKHVTFLILLLTLPVSGLSQDDLIDAIQMEDTTQVADAAFKGLKIVNFESTKMLNKREFYFVVSHRFGSIRNGFDDFFGLDFANTRLHFLYGITDGWHVSVSRNSFNKTYDLSTKYRFVEQRRGVPVTIAGYSQMAVNTLLEEALILRPVAFGDRISVTQQLLISRKFTEQLSLQLMPTFFHEGYVDYAPQDQSQYALGLGGRYKISSRWSINVDYGWGRYRNRGPCVPVAFHQCTTHL